MLKILDNDYYDLIINTISVPSYDTGDNITLLTERSSLLHIPTAEAEPCDLGVRPYSTFPSLYTPESTISIEKSGIGTVQRNPFLNLNGQGVLMGFVDTGIDYLHNAFRNADGTTRIVSIWDQTVQTGTIPEGFTFGSEYNSETINLALSSEDPLSIVPTVDTNGHGTAMASIAAGSYTADQTFTGIVPSSQIIIVKLKEAKNNLKNIFLIPEDAYCFQESDIILGIRYLLLTAQKLSLPLVICIALGTSQGSHDGKGVLSSYLTYLVQLPGVGISVSAGNEGNKQRHYFNSTSVIPFYNDFELRIGEDDKEFWMEIWPYAPERISIDISTPNRESTQRIYPSIADCRRFNFIFTQSVVWVNNIIFEEETGDQLILIRFLNPQPGVWYFRAQSLEDEPFSFHCWLPNGNLISDNTFFLVPNPDTTITSPGNGVSQLTVTAYNQFTDSILPESSRGYTRTGLVKPDIAAPGYQIPCAVPGNQYGTATGTGAASAHSAGIIAMVLEWGITRRNYTTLTGYDVNRLLIRGAQRSTSDVYPNNVWGYGTINVNNLFERLTNL
ncbi:S8 family peptidase [Clostridium boliviensis]|uniref:S8 family peptidase n=1 Tax=Clostridium boliviensis TaxID=318465 RepID=A0ABU4GIN5_9CLOT|nr:S8 family peptidase [Clostridium boliviensis]MDW2796813.1 S8 family peptidase [Clostridium boliviensis]